MTAATAKRATAGSLGAGLIALAGYFYDLQNTMVKELGTCYSTLISQSENYAARIERILGGDR